MDLLKRVRVGSFTGDALHKKLIAERTRLQKLGIALPASCESTLSNAEYDEFVLDGGLFVRDMEVQVDPKSSDFQQVGDRPNLLVKVFMEELRTAGILGLGTRGSRGRPSLLWLHENTEASGAQNKKRVAKSPKKQSEKSFVTPPKPSEKSATPSGKPPKPSAKSPKPSVTLPKPAKKSAKDPKKSAKDSPKKSAKDSPKKPATDPKNSAKASPKKSAKDPGSRGQKRSAETQMEPSGKSQKCEEKAETSTVKIEGYAGDVELTVTPVGGGIYTLKARGAGLPAPSPSVQVASDDPLAVDLRDRGVTKCVVNALRLYDGGAGHILVLLPQETRGGLIKFLVATRSSCVFSIGSGANAKALKIVSVPGFRKYVNSLQSHNVMEKTEFDTLNAIASAKSQHRDSVVKTIGPFNWCGATQFYYCLELLSGGDLIQYLPHICPLKGYEDGWLLSPADMVRIATHCAQGVSAFHETGFGHRDVKLENFCAASSEVDASIKLIDGGVAKRATWKSLRLKQNGTTHLTTGSVGTPETMAPEVCRGDAKIDWKKADIFSLGMTFKDLMYCRSLRADLDTNTFKSMDSQFTWDCIVLAFLKGDVFRSWERLVRSMLKHHPDERPTIEEVLESLVSIAKDAAAVSYTFDTLMDHLDEVMTAPVSY